MIRSTALSLLNRNAFSRTMPLLATQGRNMPTPTPLLLARGTEVPAPLLLTDGRTVTSLAIRDCGDLETTSRLLEKSADITALYKASTFGPSAFSIMSSLLSDEMVRNKFGLESSEEETKKATETSKKQAQAFLKNINEAVQQALIGIKSPNAEIQSKALLIFENLVGIWLHYNEATQAALIGIKSSDKNVQLNALNVFNSLLLRKTSYNEAAEASLIGIKSSDKDVQIKALNLLTILVRNGKGYNEAAEASLIGIKSSDKDVQTKALNLFATLARKKLGDNKDIQVRIKNKKVKTKDLNSLSKLEEKLSVNTSSSKPSFFSLKRFLILAGGTTAFYKFQSKK